MTSEFKPYYLTKALQKLKELKLLSKSVAFMMKRTVIVYVSKDQRQRIQELIHELEQYI